MAIKGGYQIIDLKNINIVTDDKDEVIIPGVFEAIAGNNGKPTLLSGISVDGDALTDRFVEFTLSSGDYVTLINGSTLTITDDDEVTLESPVTPEPDPDT